METIVWQSAQWISTSLGGFRGVLVTLGKINPETGGFPCLVEEIECEMIMGNPVIGFTFLTPDKQHI